VLVAKCRNRLKVKNRASDTCAMLAGDITLLEEQFGDGDGCRRRDENAMKEVQE